MTVLKKWISKVDIRGRTHAFTNTPAVVRSGDAVINFFPGALAYVVNEHSAGPGLKREGEGIAQAQCPDFLPGAGSVEKGSVSGNRAVGIDPQNFTQQIGQRLRIRRICILA